MKKGTGQRSTSRRGAGRILGALFVCALCAPAGAEDVRVTKLTTEKLCLSPGRNSECHATFAAVLGRAPLADDVTIAAQPDTLRFHKRASWIRRLETLGKEGIPFVRLPRGPHSELVLGIDRKGVLGFSLRQTPATRP